MAQVNAYSRCPLCNRGQDCLECPAPVCYEDVKAPGLGNGSSHHGSSFSAKLAEFLAAYARDLQGKGWEEEHIADELHVSQRRVHGYLGRELAVIR